MKYTDKPKFIVDSIVNRPSRLTTKQKKDFAKKSRVFTYDEDRDLLIAIESSLSNSPLTAKSLKLLKKHF